MTYSKILIIDDESMFREDLATILDKKGYECFTATTAEEGVEKVRDLMPDIVLSDIVMPGKSGTDILEDIHIIHPDCSVVMMTAYGSLETAVEAFRKGAVDYILKPVIIEELEKKLIRIIENRRLMREIRYLRSEAAGEVSSMTLVGKSKPMEAVYKLIEQVSPTKSHVLILGESGTGKELVARAVHNLSEASQHPFIAINCSGIPESLLESELFGYKKGAFTGATQDKTGFFEMAGKGSLFLDEISEMPLSLQSKLLRAVEEKEYYQIGGTRPLHLEARIITATNRNLRELIKTSRFRQDLYYRISVFEIDLPPLRDRKSDIPLLADFFVQKFTKDMNRNVLGLTSEAVHMLMSYSWPGNVRELRNVIERAMILCSDRYISPEQFPPQVTGLQIKQSGASDLKDSLRSYERAHIFHVLSECGWNKEAAARQLNINPSTLYRKMVDLGIQKNDSSNNSKI